MSLATLLPGSFRGVPFGVLGTANQGGRRQNVHTYPGRDTPWAEDMGRAPRRYRFTAFLLDGDQTYSGGLIDLQNQLLVAALEAQGPGLMTHPVFGVINVSVESYSLNTDLSAGTFSSVELSLVEAGSQQQPSILTDTIAALTSAAAVTFAALAIDGAAALSAATSNTGGNQALSNAAAAWSAQVQAAAQDATAILGLASTLSGPYGRFNAGGNAGFATMPYQNTNTVSGLITAAATQRAGVTAAANSVASTIAVLEVSSTGSDVASAVQTLMSALLSACANPSDAIRLLLGVASGAVASSGLAPADSAIADLYQNSAVATLAQASSSYQPSSYDDAQAVMGAVTAAIDTQIDVAGDEGADTTFQALRAMRQAVVQDLTTRGASLAPVRTFSVAGVLPDIVLAQQLYRDPSRGDQLTTQIGEIHPLFCPPTFRALAA